MMNNWKIKEISHYFKSKDEILKQKIEQTEDFIFNGIF